MQEVADDFLGRLWVPLTLGLIAAAVAISIAVSRDVVGFMLAGTVAATSITLRLTWDKRRSKIYPALIIGILVLHLCAIALFNPALSRAPGAIYMVAALIDAFIMVGIVRSIAR